MTNILPDPNNPIDNTGAANPAGTPGPGYKSVKLESNQPVMSDRTNSGRVITRAVAAQYWSIAVTYNPMLRNTFDTIDTFLLSKRGGLIPFYVSLPQYIAPKDPSLVANPTTTAVVSAASTTIPYTVAAGAPTPGDLFTVSDITDSTHTKAYKVVAVDAGVITAVPPISKNISSGSTLVFQNPMLRVYLKDSVQSYSLGVNNLYSFSLKLEEAQA